MVNPSGSDENEKIPAISIPVDSFKPLGAPLNRSYILVLRVETLPKYSVVMENDEGRTFAKYQIAIAISSSNKHFV